MISSHTHRSRNSYSRIVGPAQVSARQVHSHLTRLPSGPLTCSRARRPTCARRAAPAPRAVTILASLPARYDCGEVERGMPCVARATPTWPPRTARHRFESSRLARRPRDLDEREDGEHGREIQNERRRHDCRCRRESPAREADNFEHESSCKQPASVERLQPAPHTGVACDSGQAALRTGLERAH